MKVEYEKPIDSTEDLVLSGKDIWMKDGTWDKLYFKSSDYVWHVKALEKAEFKANWGDDIFLVPKYGKSCMLLPQMIYYNNVNVNPKYKNLPEVHFSKEKIKPYYVAWTVQKHSIWKEAINHHILIFHQVGTKRTNICCQK